LQSTSLSVLLAGDYTFGGQGGVSEVAAEYKKLVSFYYPWYNERKVIVGDLNTERERWERMFGKLSDPRVQERVQKLVTAFKKGERDAAREAHAQRQGVDGRVDLTARYADWVNESGR